MAHSKKCELTDLSRTCILHTLSVLRGQDEAESIECINKFCKRLYQAVQYKRLKDSLQAGGVDSKKSLNVDSQSVKSYCSGGSAEKLLFKIELKLNECAVDDFEEESLFKACWEVYHEHKQPWPEQIVVEFSSHHLRESVYNLWLVFNAIVPSASGKLTTPANNLDVLMKRMYDLCGHACSRDELRYGSTMEIDFLGYVKIVARYQRKFNLNPKLTSKVIQDLRDEVVDAILKKSYLTKRGHKVKNWKRRWFVLWKTVMRYYECKERPVLKGQIVLNATTEVREAPDGRWRHCFEVVCGKTMKRYKISADDEKSRHAWIMAIKKAIDLARILSGREPIRKISIPSNPLLAANFYLTRFQASHSLIPKWEGAVKKVFDFGEENVSEEETEDGVHFRSKPRSKSSLTDDSITIPIPKPRSTSDPKSVRGSSDYSILSEQSPGNFQLDGHTFKRVTSCFINDNIHHIVAITDDGYVVVPKSVGEDVGAQECTSILDMPEESAISILTKAAPEKVYIPVKDDHDGTGGQYIDRMRSFSRSLSELDKIQGSMFGNDYLQPLTDQGGVKELSKSTQSLSFKSTVDLAIDEQSDALAKDEVVAMEQFESKVKQPDALKKVTLYCSQHQGKELELYCETCEELICHNCTVNKHSGPEHKYDLVSDTFEKHKAEITASLDKVEEKLSLTKEALEQLDMRSQDLDYQQAKVAEIVRIMKRQFASRRDELETVQSQLASCLSFVRDSLKRGSEEEVMMMKNGVMKQIKEMTDNFKLDDTRTCETADVEIPIHISQPQRFSEMSLADPESYFYHPRLFRVDTLGEKIIIKEHDIVITIPEGAIEPGETVQFKTAVALCGPFNFSGHRQPISPILMLCPQSHPNLVLRKPMEVTLPHYLTYLEEGDYEKYDITFAKADHTSNGFNFQPLRNESADVQIRFKISKDEDQRYGILRSTHCCCVCITTYGVNQSLHRERTLKAGYCLSRVETPLENYPRTVQITFFVTFMLRTCLESLKSQLPSCDHSVRHYKFRLATNNVDSKPSLQIIINRESNDYRVVGVDPTDLKICSSHVEFWDSCHELQLLHETQQYPPRAKVTVHLTADSSTTPVTFPTRFLGCTEDSKLDVDIPLLLPHDSRLKVSKTLECVTGDLRIADKHLSGLFQQLKKHAFKWREIGMHLGFLPGELSTIEGRPSLIQGAPVSYLGALLEESIQWAPGDSRGSTSFTTLDSLKAALNEAGLGAAAHDLKIVSA